VTRHSDTVDVAGIAFQLSCRFPKPSFWACRRPGLVTRHPPDVVVRIDYVEGYRGRAGRQVGDTVADAADVRRRGRGLFVSTGYYRAAVDTRGGRVAVRMAAGFEVGGLMRTLAALWLLERQTLLIRAACLGPAASATLACGLADGAPQAAISGWLAVSARPDGVFVRPTPFVDGDSPLGADVRRATTLSLPGALPAPRPVGAAMALGALLPSIWQADRRRPAVEHTLDLATRVVTTLRCEMGSTSLVRDEAAVG